MSEASPLSNLTPVQIKQLQRVFYALDKNADGRVSQEDEPRRCAVWVYLKRRKRHVDAMRMCQTRRMSS